MGNRFKHFTMRMLLGKKEKFMHAILFKGSGSLIPTYWVHSFWKIWSDDLTTPLPKQRNFPVRELDVFSEYPFRGMSTLIRDWTVSIFQEFYFYVFPLVSSTFLPTLGIPFRFQTLLDLYLSIHLRFLRLFSTWFLNPAFC